MKRLYSLGLIILLITASLVACATQENHKQPATPKNDTQKQSLQNIDEAVGLAIKGRSTAYALGETATEGHIILDTEEKNGTIKVYTIASYGAFGFENGIFTKVSGSGAIPTVITFSKDKSGEYSLLEYKEPLDGAGFSDSVKKMFPRKLHSRLFSTNGEDYLTLAQEQEIQAAEYLKSIDRKAEVSAAHVAKKLPDIDVQASNKLFAELTKYSPFLNNCPYWLGTKEKVENGVRYIYETSQSKTGDEYDLIIFRKKKEDGTIVEEYKYKIVGSEPQLIDNEVELLSESAEHEKITVSYWLGEAGEKTREYIVTSLPDGLKALLNATGDTILSGFEDFNPMLDLILAKKDDGWRLYDQAGKKINEQIFEEISNPEMPDGYKANGLVRVKQKGLWGAIDQKGNIVIKPDFDSIYLNYYEEVEPFIKVERNNKFGYVTYEGKQLVDTIWDTAFMDVLNVRDDIIFVREGDQWGGIRVRNDQATAVDWELEPSEEAMLGFNNWQYQRQKDFYVHQIQNGETDITTATKIFFNDYFRKNSRELRSLPDFPSGNSPDWDKLTKFIYENYQTLDPDDRLITMERFAQVVEKYFGDITYTHKSSSYLTYNEGKYSAVGWSDHGFFIYELTDLEKNTTEDGKDKWQATITGYYFYELDGDPDDTVKSKNAQAVWEEMKKEEYNGHNFWMACNRLAWNNPGEILEPAVEWVIEFTVNDPWGDIYFTYLSCESKWYQ